jgi:hypothetical protein
MGRGSWFRKEILCPWVCNDEGLVLAFAQYIDNRLILTVDWSLNTLSYSKICCCFNNSVCSPRLSEVRQRQFGNRRKGVQELKCIHIDSKL